MDAREKLASDIKTHVAEVDAYGEFFDQLDADKQREVTDRLQSDNKLLMVRIASQTVRDAESHLEICKALRDQAVNAMAG